MFFIVRYINMTVRRLLGISKMHEPPEKISQQQSRRVTDKAALRLYPLLTVVYILFYMIFKLAEFGSHRSLHESWEKKPYSNSPNEAISNVVLLVNATLRAVQDENLYKNPCISFISGLLGALFCVGIAYFIFIRVTIAKLISISRKTFNKEYLHHYMVINGSRTMISVICLVVLNSQWNSPSKKFNFCAVLWGLMEFLNLNMNLMSCIASCGVKIRTPTFIDVLRFYYLRRNLILFQLLNLMAMLSIVAGVAVLVKVYWESSMSVYQFALVGSFFFVAIIHTCAKMAIMLASASYNCDGDEGGISWKLIATSLWTILRYHLGSIIFYFPALECISYTNHEHKTRDCTKEELYTPNDPILTMECSEMLVAIHGQFFGESKNTLCHSKMKNWINKNFKSIASMVWSDTTAFSFSMFAVVVIVEVITESSSAIEDLLTPAVYVSAYFLIHSLYYYIIIRPVNVIEMTIEFSKIATKEELKVMEWELSNESEDVITDI